MVLVNEATQERSHEFTFDGSPVHALEGDTIAAALTRAGIKTFSRSMKFHRPRGMYCGSGRCNMCSMRVDGIPGVRSCSTLSRPGMTVETERGFPSTNYDVLSALDHLFPRRLDYRRRFIRPAFMVPFYLWVVRRLASANRIPDKDVDFKPLERKKCDVLVIGQGISGTVASSRIRGRGIRSIMAIDRTSMGESSLSGTAVGFYEDGSVGVLLDSGIQIVKARAVLIATGRQELGLPLVRGDIPGNMLPGAVHQLVARGIRPGKKAAIIGKNDSKELVLRELRSAGVEIVADVPDASGIGRLLGHRRISGIETREKQRIRCDLVVPLGPLVPAVGIAHQAGCELVPVGEHWCVRTDPEGLTSVAGVYACGGVAGLTAKEDRIASGLAAGEAILRFLGVT